jgi:V8-like Glu-specific endopeptidase
MRLTAWLAACGATVTLVSCGGGGSSGPPTAPAPIPAVNACDAVGALGQATGSRISILNGAKCNPGNAPVVKLNLRSPAGDPMGSCTGTIVAPRAVLTAAHCVDNDNNGQPVGTVRVWLGSGPEIVADSFTFYPGFVFNQSGFDVGVVLMAQDLPRTPVPLLTSRQAAIGETAIIAGYGRDNDQSTTTLNAGSTTISNVTASQLQTLYAPPASSVCSGDSGGPIFLAQGGRWTIAGITSATTQAACNDGINYYQSVRQSNVLAFIKQHIPNVSER